MRALVTGIQPYISRLNRDSEDHTAPRFDAFAPIRTKQEVYQATAYIQNTGNFFIGESAIEAVGREKAVFVEFRVLASKIVDPEYLSIIYSQFDCLVLVTANLLRCDYDAAAEAELLEQIDLPVVVLGIGCQSLSDLQSGLPTGTLRLIEVLKSKDHHIFTRGVPSADYLISKGLNWVWSTGCPSLFMRPKNVISSLFALKRLDWDSSLRIAFSGYLGRDSEAVREMTMFGNRRSGCNYILQDEHVHYGLSFEASDVDEVYDDLSGAVMRVAEFCGFSAIKNIGLRLFFDTNQWRAAMAMHDLSLGKRFHGGVAALQTGVPALMIAIDHRMLEMLDQIHLPYIRGDDWNAAERKGDKLALIERTIEAFEPEQWSEGFLRDVELFRVKMGSIGLG